MHHKSWQPGVEAVLTAEFIAPDDPRWRQMLEHVRHDFYHLPEYAALCSEQEGGDAVAFYAETGRNTFLVPLLAKRVALPPARDGEWRDLAAPYGYPSPLLLDPCDRTGLREMMGAFRWVAREQGFVSAFVRLHPLLPLPNDVLQEYGEVVMHGETVSIDLTLSEELLWKQIRRDRRSGIRKLVRQGFHVVMDAWGGLDEFIRIYRETMQRVKASEYYYFPRSYFSGLRAALGERLHLCQVLSPGGRVAAAGLFVLTDGVVELHLSGTATEYCRMGPSKLMLYEIGRAGKRAGASVMHLGGGVGGRRDTLFEFKAAFSPLRNPFGTYRMVLHRERYQELCRWWQQQSRNIPLNSDYFPLYRYSG